MSALVLARSQPDFVSAANTKAENAPKFDPLSAHLSAAPANDNETFPGRKMLLDLGRTMTRTEDSVTAATSRCRQALDKLAADQIVSKSLDRLDPAELATTPAAAPVGTRSSAIAASLISRTSKLPTDAQIDAFIDLNSRLGRAQQEFAEKWKPVSDLYDSSSGRKPSAEELQAVIAKTGDPAQYKADTENIARLVATHKTQSEDLVSHLSAYREANGTTSEVLDAAGRVYKSIKELGDQSHGSIPDAEGEPADGLAGRGLSQVENDNIDDITETLRAIIEKMIELLRKLFGCDNEDKPSGPK